MSTSTSTRTQPATGTWVLDTGHTSIEGVARHLMVTKVRVRFQEFSGTADIAEPVTESRIDVTIQADSISTGDSDRDAHVKSGDFLDVEQFPTIEFASSSIEHVKDDRYELNGNLTMHGVTRPVTLEMTYHGVATDPWGNGHAAFEATGEIDREDFGITWNQALETGGVLVSKTIRLDFDVQLVQKSDD